MNVRRRIKKAGNLEGLDARRSLLTLFKKKVKLGFSFYISLDQS